MKSLLTAIPALALSAQVHAQAQITIQPGAGAKITAPAELHGTWGTAAQCAAHKAADGENPGLSPYVITNDWIKQGLVYCYMTWHGNTAGAGGSETLALAQCGEDTLRDYRVLLRLSDGKLRIHWSDDFNTQPLEICR